MRGVIRNPILAEPSRDRSIDEALRLALSVTTKWSVGVIVSRHLRIWE